MSSKPDLPLDPTPGAFPTSPEPESPVHVDPQLTLAQAVYKRRAEYTVKRKIRIKVGTWNVASLNGTEKDIKGWFVDGKGISERLSGVTLHDEGGTDDDGGKPIESVEHQEEREGNKYRSIPKSKASSTLPKNDPGTVIGGDEVGLYVLGLQEIVDISSPTETFKSYTDTGQTRKWKQAMAEALPPGYHRVAEQQLLGLFIVVYASPQFLPEISNVSVSSVGTGLFGYMANKGSVSVRIVLGETTRLVFINCHLSAGTEKSSLERRNWDAAQILSKTKFEPVDDGVQPKKNKPEMIGDEDFAFWLGDLNYRLEGIPDEDVRRLLMLHTRGEYGQGRASEPKIAQEISGKSPKAAVSEVRNRHEFPGEDEAISQVSSRSNDDSASRVSSEFSIHNNHIDLDSASTDHIDPSVDPTSLKATLDSLLSHDQLHQQIRSHRCFHQGWREGDIHFLPTYKYDVGSVGLFDTSEKKRGPSFCDRILFRSRQDRLEYEKMSAEQSAAKVKETQMEIQGVMEAARDESVLFDYDPENDGAEAEEGENDSQALEERPLTRELNYLHLEEYTSHQRVLSSDHKPITALYDVDYFSYDPESRARIRHQIAREFDQAENEGRPVVTIVQSRSLDSPYPADLSPGDHSIDFGNVRYRLPASCSLTVANIGPVAAVLGFVDRPSETPAHHSGVAPEWLAISFDRQSDNQNANPHALHEYTVQPGDAINIELTIFVSNITHVRQLNRRQQSLDENLVLRVQSGRDHFIPIHGNWQQSAFGRSIPELTRLPTSCVRQLQHYVWIDDPAKPAPRSAPAEFVRLTNDLSTTVAGAIEQGCDKLKASPNWISQPGWPFLGQTERPASTNEALQVHARELFDTGADLAADWAHGEDAFVRAEAIATLLVEFVDQLYDGVVPPHVTTELDTGIIQRYRNRKPEDVEEAQGYVLEVMSQCPANSTCFTFIVFMLADIARQVAAGARETTFKTPAGIGGEALRQLTEGVYAQYFAEHLFRLPPGMSEKDRKASIARMRIVMELFQGASDNDV